MCELIVARGGIAERTEEAAGRASGSLGLNLDGWPRDRRWRCAGWCRLRRAGGEHSRSREPGGLSKLCSSASDPRPSHLLVILLLRRSGGGKSSNIEIN